MNLKSVAQKFCERTLSRGGILAYEDAEYMGRPSIRIILGGIDRSAPKNPITAVPLCLSIREDLNGWGFALAIQNSIPDMILHNIKNVLVAYTKVNASLVLRWEPKTASGLHPLWISSFMVVSTEDEDEQVEIMDENLLDFLLKLDDILSVIGER